MISGCEGVGMRCKICDTPQRFFQKAKVLGKYEVAYFQCPHCGFVQTEDPYWLDEAYSSAITESDLGLVRRNLANAQIAASVIMTLFDSGARFLDYGGGYGLLVRLMRDRGFDFYYFDRFSTPLFAGVFEADLDSECHYELVTAFEVWEHLVDPLEEIRHMLQFSRSILFTTALLPQSNPRPQEWWYYGLEHGQHVALYSRRALQSVAERFDLNLLSDGRSLHLLTPKAISGLLFSLVSHYRIAALASLIFRKKSLLPGDYQKVVGRPLR
jgi:hypothetical protein